jgi:hypothetical protein
MYTAKPRLGESAKPFRTLLVNVLGRPIDGNPLEERKCGPGETTYFSQIVSPHSDRIASGKKKRADVGPEVPACLQDVFLNIINLPYPVSRPVLVHHAKCTSIMRTPDSRLNQQRISLAGRTIYRAFITHGDALFFLKNGGKIC